MTTTLTLEEEAMAVLQKERLWMEYEGDSDDDDELRYAFIEAASNLVQRITGHTLRYDDETGSFLIVQKDTG